VNRPEPDRLAVWRAFLEAHAAITKTLEAELERERDMPLAWYDVLLQLHEADGRLRMSELANRLLTHRSSLTRLIDRMDSAGLVTREGCPSDGRGSMAVLTREGREALRRAAPVHLRGIQEHFAGYLTDSDVVAMHRALAKLPGAGTSRGS
jgi:DNA-binding MarR family transcriptional regulator